MLHMQYESSKGLSRHADLTKGDVVMVLNRRQNEGCACRWIECFEKDLVRHSDDVQEQEQEGLSTVG
jgi:hypothetical protein